MSDDRVIKSYVWHEDKCFFVSTIERDSSAAEGPRRYNETIVWEYDWERRVTKDIVGMGEDHPGGIRTHQRIVEELHNQGYLSE